MIKDELVKKMDILRRHAKQCDCAEKRFTKTQSPPIAQGGFALIICFRVSDAQGYLPLLT
jgi:hypothetical protein